MRIWCSLPCLLWVVGLSGCTGGPAVGVQTQDSGAQNTNDSGDFSLELSVEDTQVGTVKRIRWEGLPGDMLVYQVATGEARLVPGIEDGDEMTALLWGFGVFSTARFQVMRESETGPLYTALQSVSMGGLPSSLPELGQLSGSGDVEGLFFVPVLTGKGALLAMIDADGRYIWAFDPTDDPSWAGDQYFSQARFSEDGETLLALTSSSDGLTTEAEMGIYRMGLDGVVQDIVSHMGLHLSFDELDVGHYAVLGYERTEQETNGQEVYDDVIIELEDGVARQVWSAMDTFPLLDASEDLSTGWAHVNFLSYDDAHDAFLLSVMHLEAYASVARADGELNWLLTNLVAPYESTLTVVDTTAEQLVSLPHSITHMSDGEYLVFNRSAPSGCSEATRFQVTADTTQVSLVSQQSSGGPGCLLVNFLGQSMALTESQTLVNWSDKGQLDVYNEAGESVWQVQIDIGAAFGFVDWTSSFGE